MSFSNFDDINSICIELAEEEESIATIDQIIGKLYPGQTEYPISERSSLFQDKGIFPVYK